MSLSLKNSRVFRWLIKLLKYFFTVLLAAVLLVSLILVFLPTAISTDWSRRYIQGQVSNALNRPVTIERIDWSWTDGIVISKLAVSDLPEFSESSLVLLDRIKLKLNVKRLLHRELSLELLLADLDINVIKDSSGTLNVETPGRKDRPPALPEKGEAGDEKDKKSFILPIEVSAEIRLKRINLTFDDREKSQKYKVKDIEITLDAPSLKTSPVDLAIGMDIKINDLDIPRSTLRASVKNLFDADGSLNIYGLVADLDAGLPGFFAEVDIDMAASGIKGKIQIDPASVMKVAVPLIPDFPSPMDINGAIELTAAGEIRPDKPLAFNAIFAGSDLEVSGKIIDGKSIGPGNFSVHVNGIIDLNAERLDLETCEIRILENSHIHASGRVEQIKQDDKKIHMAVSPLYLDIGELALFARPLIPGFPSPTDIKGSIELTAATGIRPDEPLAFDAVFAGSDLEVSGKVIDGKSIGPGNFSVHVNGIIDLNAERLDLETCEIRILENSHIHASGRVEQIKQDDKKIHMAVSPLYLDISELALFARPFIPPSIEIDDHEKQAAVSIKKLQLDGLMPKGRTDVLLDELQVNLPAVLLKDKVDKKFILQLSGVRMVLESLDATLIDLFPQSAALNLSAAVDKLISGKDPDTILVSNIRLDQLNVDAVKIKKPESSRFGISGNLLLDNKLKIERVYLPDLVQVDNLEQSLKIRAALRPDDSILGSLDHLDVVGKKISVLKKDQIPLDTGVDIHLALDELFLKNFDPVNADIKDFSADLKIENALNVEISASAIDTANTSFSTKIDIDSNLDALTDKFPGKLLPGISGSGKLNISLNAAGRRPGDNKINTIKNKLLTENLEFIDKLKVNINLDHGAVAISRPDQNPVSVESITAAPLLSYELNGKTGKGNIVSLIKAGSVKGLPGIDKNMPISGKLSLSASHEYAKTIDLNQSLSVAPAGIDENIHITIDGLDRIITQSPLPELSQWISKVGGAISANVKIPDCSALEKMGPPVLLETGLSGLLAAGVSFALIPDRSVGGGISLTINDMNFTVPETASFENIDANIDFSKSYLIQSAEKALPVAAADGLSVNVIEPAGQHDATAARNLDIYRHIRLLHERMNLSPALSFQKADVMSAPFPLILDESMIMLNLDNGLPNLDYFQFNLLGGTINGSIALFNTRDQVKKPFNVNTALTFSGINTARIFPRAFSKEDYSKANISGLLYADLPVTDQLQTILENMAVTVEFTRIGSRALERLLYALDPYESNEAIVAQRRLLKNGSPEKIRLDIKDGFLSLSGKVTVKGIEISMPAIRRLNIALIPGIDRFEDNLAGLLPVIDILHKISAEHIVIDKQADTIAFE